MYTIYEYARLCNEGYTGVAWNVSYEFSDGEEVWGHGQEYDDELDAWFMTFDEAIEFADECYPDDVMEEKLVGDLAGDATSVILNIEECWWNNGSFDLGNESYFRLYEKDDNSDEIFKSTSKD